MKKLLLSLVALAALATTASAAPTTVGDFRGTVQTDTSTGVHTITLGTDTTIVRLNASSLSEIVGMTGGADGRMVLFWNIGSANALFYHENTNATAANRLVMDANGGSLALWNSGLGLGMAVYDGTTQRWRFAPWEGFNTAGGKTVNGDLGVTASAVIVGVITAASEVLAGTAGTRLTLQSITSGNNGSNIRWKNSAGTALFTMGPDFYANAGQDWWLFDNVNSITNMYVKNTATSFLSFGTSSGGLLYDESKDELGLFAFGQVNFRIGGYQGRAIKINAPMFYRRMASGTPKPTLNSNCNGSGTATWALADSNDSRGAITLGTGSSACTIDFAIPWDATVDNTNQGQPVCVANTSTSGRSVAITASGDHNVTFTPSASGATTIYYHCDGIAPPTL